MPRSPGVGSETKRTELGREIVAEDLAALDRRAASGWNVDEPAEIYQGFWELPLTLALDADKLAVVRWLLDRGVNLNDAHAPAIVSAARSCDAATLELLVAHGARVDAVDRVGKNAYAAALYGERLDLLPVLARLGLRVDADGGVSLRQAAFQHRIAAVKFFVERGIDVNAHVPDMVMPNNPTAVAVAARNGDLEMVRYLVEHGADIRIKDEYGDRPYSYAVAARHDAVQAYLKALEPAEWHSEEQRIAELQPFKIPAALLAYLRGSERRMTLGDGAVEFIEFHSLLGVKPIRWRQRRFLDLLAVVENYWAVGFLAWSPKDLKLVHVDFERDRMKPLCKWPEFVAEPARWINSVFE